MANWAPEASWNVPGIYFAEEEAIVYDVNTAFPPAEKKGGWTAKRQKEAAEAVND